MIPVWKQIYDFYRDECIKGKGAKSYSKIQDFVEAVLGKDYIEILVGGKQNATINRIYNGETKATTVEVFAKKLIEDHATYCNSICRKTIFEHWKALLSASIKRNIKVKIGSNIVEKLDVNIEIEKFIKDNLMKMLEDENGEEKVMTAISLIASTYYYWWDNRIENSIKEEMVIENLKEVIFPDLQNDPEWNEKVEKIRKREEKKALELLNKPENSLTDDDIREIETQIVYNDAVSNEVKGWAEYILYNVCRHEDINTAKKMLKASYNHGCDRAKEEWKRYQEHALFYSYEHSGDTSEGIYFINTENLYTKIIEDTAPLGWKKYLLKDDKEILSLADEARSIRYFLLDENEKKNFKDLLHLLEQFRDEKDNKDIHIYIRIKMECYSHLIDTAEQHLNGKVIPVHIIDDNKIIAQNLLFQHPLFYPIRFLRKQDNVKSHFNIIVIGNAKNISCLIRQVYCLSNFQDIIKTKIWVMVDADELKQELSVDCQTLIDNKAFEIININLESNAIFDELEKLELYGKNQYCYFIIDKGKDEDNLALSIHLREWITRKNVKKWAKKYSDSDYNKKVEIREIEMPVIAFKCEDPNISFLARTMVVQQEVQGDRWYNNYNLLPYGGVNERYEWNRITYQIGDRAEKCSNVLEKIAVEIHMSYMKYSDKSNREKLQTYYMWQYNMDSSRAQALSFPYRLFQMQALTLNREDNKLIPTFWNITEENVYNEFSCRKFADILKTISIHDGVIPKVAKWEHERWVRYMQINGWSISAIEEMIAYMKAGNPGHQLFIGRMHPCMCDFDNQAGIKSKLEDIFEIKKDFKENDIDSIKFTKELLKCIKIKEIEEERAVSVEKTGI